MKLQTSIFLAVTVAFAVLLIVASSNPATAGEGLKITEMAVTTKVVRGKPIDAVRRISSTSVKTLFCFTRINNSSGKETAIMHVWYHNGERVRESKLPVKGKKWRAYSRRDISKGSAGNWRVDVLDSDGNLLKSVEFTIN